MNNIVRTILQSCEALSDVLNQAQVSSTCAFSHLAPFTKTVCKRSLVERLDLRALAVLIMIEGKLTIQRAKPGKVSGHLPSKQYDPELHQVYGKLLHEVYFRLDGAMQAFFRRVANAETPGFPRVRPRHNFFTLVYPAMYLKIEGNTLILPTGGGSRHGPKTYPNVRARLTEEAPEGYREVAISRDTRGNYYASFVHARKEEEPQEQSNVVAFDLGIKTLATGVNDQGRIYNIGGFKGGRWYNKQLDKIRRKRSKCKKKSRRYIRLSQVYKRISEKKRNKQKDSHHKASHLIASRLVERTAVIGDLSQRQMVMKEHQERNKQLNRVVYNDWGLYSFVQMLVYKCALYGKELHLLDERNTSKMCSECGNMQDMPLHKRTYRCPVCGLVMDRDENSARNILTRYFARLGPHASMQKCGVLHDENDEVGVVVAPHFPVVQQLTLW